MTDSLSTLTQKELAPQYEPDDGPLTAKQLKEIKARAAPELARLRVLHPNKPRSVSSSLFPV
jgi:hypothetical protein